MKSRLRVKSVLKWSLIALGNLWLLSKIFLVTTVTDLPEALANLYAKELCSCRFVVGLPLERCLEDRFALMRPSRIQVDEKQAALSVRVLWAVSTAKVDDVRFGCHRVELGRP